MATNQANPLPVSSSKPPDFPSEQAELFRHVMQLLNRQGIPYAVSGAFALQHHTGIWRNTKDLDLFLTGADSARALEILRGEGYECEICDPVWLSKVRRGDYFVDLITGMSNGVISVDASWIQRSLPISVLGIETRVLAAEELLASKLFVLFRERYDGADIVHIIYGKHGKLDWQRILTLVGEHRDLLFSVLALFHYVYPANSNLVPRGVWQTLMDDLRQSLESPDPRIPFRGSLLDENMFAIDVKEWGLPNLLERYRERRVQKINQESKAA